MPEDLPRTLARCNVISNDEMEPNRSILIVVKSNEERLSEKKLLDYHEYRKRFLSWLLNIGKDPKTADGYSPYTVYGTNYRTARFDRWVWDHRDGYHIPPTFEDAKAYLQELAYSDKSQTAKGKAQEGLHRYSKWLQYEYGYDEWEFEFSFDGSGGSNQPRDYLSKNERRQIRQAALEEGSIPAYDSLSVSEREQWGGYIAQVLEKPYADVQKEDWETVEGWKLPSLVWTSLDAGLRPVEVGRARTSWVDTSNSVLRIPREESSKNEGNWTVSLTERTARALKRWLVERDMYDRYAETDRLWLTYRGNPYGANSLRRLLHRLCDKAGIETTNRQMSWYTIRHSVGTYMTQERDLAAAKAQLRHKSVKTTMKYDQAPVEDRRDALDRMG